MSGYIKNLSLQLPTSDPDGLVTSGSGVGAGTFTLNGALVSGGVGNLVTAQRVGVTSAADDSGITFTVTGTDRYGRAQSETISGKNADIAFTKKDFLTVTSVSRSGSTGGAVTIGTIGLGSSEAFIVDRFVNPNNHMTSVVSADISTIYSIEVSDDDLSPAYDLANNDTTWWKAPNFADQTGNQRGLVEGPMSMMKLTVHSGTGLVRATITTPLKAGRI